MEKDSNNKVPLNVNRREINQEMNTDLRITKLDRQKILTQIKEIKEFILNSNESIDESILQEKFEYLYKNLPILFNTLKDDPNMPIDILEKMVNTVFLLGNKQIDPMQARIYIGHLLHDRYTNVNKNLNKNN